MTREERDTQQRSAQSLSFSGSVTKLSSAPGSRCTFQPASATHSVQGTRPGAGRTDRTEGCCCVRWAPWRWQGRVAPSTPGSGSHGGPLAPVERYPSISGRGRCSVYSVGTRVRCHLRFRGDVPVSRPWTLAWTSTQDDLGVLKSLTQDLPWGMFSNVDFPLLVDPQTVLPAVTTDAVPHVSSDT